MGVRVNQPRRTFLRLRLSRSAAINFLSLQPAQMKVALQVIVKRHEL